MAIFRGLNIGKGMIDVDDPRKALINLGLNREDFDLIRGITQAGVDVSLTDFHALSGLTESQVTTFKSLAGSAEKTLVILEGMSDIRVPMDFNMSISNNLVGQAIKFNYIDFDTVDGDDFWTLTGADISTSRTSSWSPVGTAPNETDYIIYGGEIQVTGDSIAFTSLETTTAPISKTFRAEVATHVIEMNNTNAAGSTSTHQFLAMKGIPLIWDTYFRDADLGANIISGGVSDSQGIVPMTWRITNTDGSGTSYNSGDGTAANPGSLGLGTLTSPATYTFRDTSAKPRTLEFFYDPSKIESLTMKTINLLDWTNVSLPALKKLNIESNDFSIIPQFRSDATVAKSGYAGGAGLATALEEITLTGNNLSRGAQFLNGIDGFTETTSVTAGTASAQLNRLPTTIKKITINGCFTDSVPIDLIDYEILTDLNMSSVFQRTLSRIMTATTSPIVYDPLEATTGLRSVADLWPGGNGTITTISLASLPSGYVATWFDNANGSLSATKIYVKYDQRVSATSVMGAGVGGLTDGEVYVFEKIGDGSGNLVNVRTKADDGAITMTISGSTVGGHSFTKCDINGNLSHYGSNGITNYDTYKQSSIRKLSPGVYRSPNTVRVDIRQNRIETNSEYPNWVSTSKAASSVDISIPAFRSTNLVNFYSEYNTHNIIDMSNQVNLKVYSHRSAVVSSKYDTPEKTLDSKFDNCPALVEFNIFKLRSLSGNFKTNGMFQSKPELSKIDTRWGTGFDGGLQDDMFLGSNKIKRILWGGDRFGRFNNDLLGTSGATNHQGQTFVNSTGLIILYIHYNWWSSGAMKHPTDDQYDLDLSNCGQLSAVYLAGNDLRGGLLSLNANTNLKFYDAQRNSVNKEMYRMQANQTYTILSLRSGTGTDATSLEQWVQSGWVSAGTDPVSGLPHSTTPTVGDSFVAQTINPKTVQMTTGKKYVIMQVGTHSVGEWQSIMNGTPSIYQGRVFIANAASAIGGTNSGGEVIPYTYDRIKGRGLTGTFPVLTQPLLNNVRMHTNSFIGQFPKLELPQLKNLEIQYNEFSGSIPDFSACPRIRTLKMQNNRLSTYTSGFLKDCTYMSNFNFSNNRLRGTIATDLINDLYENYIARPRGGVTVNFLGQSADDGVASFGLTAIENDGTNDSPDSTINKLAALRSSGWTILLD